MTEISNWDPWEELYRLENDKEFYSSLSLSRVLEIIISTEAPVPDHLRNRSKEQSSLEELKLSQKIGILLFLIEEHSTFQGVLERFQFLQEVASIEALLSGMEFSRRLQKDERLRLGKKHVFFYFLSSPFHLKERKRFRKNRIRGYRDKGTLPDIHLRAVNRAQEESFMSILSLENSTQEFLRENLPDYLFEGDLLDIPGTKEFLESERLLLDRLERILTSKI